MYRKGETKPVIVTHLVIAPEDLKLYDFQREGIRKLLKEHRKRGGWLKRLIVRATHLIKYGFK